MKGIIDLHVHGAPDITPRKATELEIAKKAQEYGMVGILFKSHSRTTTKEINDINKKLGEEIAFSSLVLNEFCKGFNKKIVEEEARNGIKVVFMPTLSSLNHRSFEGKEGGLTILRKGELRPEIQEILRLIAENDLTLATGHLSGKEIFVLVKEANKVGVRKVLVTHPDLKLVDLSLKDQKRLLKYGVYFERTFYSCINPNFPYGEEPSDLTIENGQAFSPKMLDSITKSIRETGVKNNVLTSDLGQVQNLDPVEGFRFYLEKLRQRGFSEEDLETMSKTNPAKLLGLYKLFIKEYIKNYVRRQEKNQPTKYREPVIGLGSADNLLFRRLKKVVRSSHNLPEDLLEDAKTVVSIFLPFSKEIISSNYKKQYTSKEWALAYTETNELLDRLCSDLANELTRLGHYSIGIKTTHHLSYAKKDHYEYDELFSDWSQRHVAYICGVGRFGVNNMIITERGCAGRLGSLITTLSLKPSPIINVEYCLAKLGKNCYRCIENCPVGALSKSGEFNRLNCMNFLVKQRKYQEKNYDLKEETQTCGKCSTNIPCEERIPVEDILTLMDSTPS
ncbi:MAG: DUF6282 family protein [Nitrososphaerales archaeon]